MGRWIKPEIYPLFAATGVAVGMCVFQLARNLITNPDVRLSKEKRSAGVVENWEEGERYAEHGVRKYLSKRAPEIMPSINSIFNNTTSK